MLKRLIISLVIFSVPMADVAAAPKGCFSADEHQAEWEVRHGLRLREGAARCSELTPAPADLWKSVEAKFGTKFKAQTDKRRRAFEREFQKKAVEELAIWDGRIVTHFRHYPLSPAYCADVEARLKEVQSKGWNAFKSQAAKDRNDIRLNYKLC